MHPDSGPTRRLALMRHARAEPQAASDRERRLTDAGRKDAATAGAWLSAEGWEPDSVLLSTAQRTRDTWEAVAEAAGWTVRPQLESALYAADAETVLDMLRELPDDPGCLLVIGHNPTIAYLAHLLDDGEGDPEVITQMAAGYPTSAVTLFEHAGTWAEVAHGCARVVGFHVGRG